MIFHLTAMNNINTFWLSYYEMEIKFKYSIRIVSLRWTYTDSDSITTKILNSHLSDSSGLCQEEIVRLSN